MSTSVTISLPGTIHNPAAPNHFMRIKPVRARVRILRDGVVLANTVQAVRVLEIGHDILDPVVYIPKTDVTEALLPKEGTPSNGGMTHCPLKGNAHYFDWVDSENTVLSENIAWTYDSVFDFASALKDRVGFYASKVTIEESPV